jgi:cation:H+ antiporter
MTSSVPGTVRRVTYGLLALSFTLLIGGAIVFTNAVEWAGHRLGLGHGAIGSILAAVATALPESLIPIVAIIGGREGSGDVALGAIIGAPFVLATVAMALVGISALAFRRRREQGVSVQAHRPTLRRDFLIFFVLFATALALGLVGSRPLRLGAAVAVVVVYGIYVWRTLSGGGEPGKKEELAPLYVDPTKRDPPASWQIGIQVFGGVAAIAGGAHLFVEEVREVADSLGVTPLVLALVLAPLASELPEKFNSFLWIREGKDSLALGNITGAMVFQSAVPVAVGLAFTPWEFDIYPALAASLALVGGLIAFWATTLRCRFGFLPMASWAGLFVAFVAYVAVTAG